MMGQASGRCIGRTLAAAAVAALWLASWTSFPSASTFPEADPGIARSHSHSAVLENLTTTTSGEAVPTPQDRALAAGLIADCHSTRPLSHVSRDKADLDDD